MQTQIRLSSLILAGLISIGLVAVLVLLRPPMTQVYCMQLLGLTAGAGLIVTVYNCVMTARMRRRSAAVPTVLVQEERAEDAAVRADAQGTAEQEMLPSVLPDENAADALPENLDALLDAAYEAAAQEPMRAVAAYRQALARYPNDSYMPYLIIELSTLYKRMGDYDAALALFDETLALPIVAKNAVSAPADPWTPFLRCSPRGGPLRFLTERFRRNCSRRRTAAPMSRRHLTFEEALNLSVLPLVKWRNTHEEKR